MLFVGRCDGTMLVSGMSVEAFESRIRAIHREALGQRPGPSGVLHLQSSPLDVVREPVQLPPNSGPVNAPMSGPTLSEVIEVEMPGGRNFKTMNRCVCLVEFGFLSCPWLLSFIS